MKKIALIILLSLSGLSAYGQSAIELKEVTVKAKSVIRTPDGMILIPDREQTRHSASGYDLVRNLMIPGVSVNVAEGKVDALGGAVSLYIDGQPAEAREVRQLRPADVARIQYMETPTGRYAGDRTAINFILKKRDSGGYVGIDALQRIGYMGGDYNLSAKLYSGKTQYTLFSGTDYKSIHGAALTGDEIIMFPQSIIGREFATSDSKTVSNSQYAWFRVRNKNERRTLRATFNFVRSASPEDYSSSSLSYTGLETPLTVNADKCSKSRNFKYSLGLSGTFEFAKGHFMDVSASATASRNHYSYDYVENDSPVNSDTGEDYYNFSANVLYGMKFERGNSLVFKVSEFHNVSSANYSGANNSWQHLWSSETICFGQYSHPLWGKASVQVAPGFSAQLYRLHGEKLTSFIGPRLQTVFAMQPARNQALQLQLVYGNSYPQLSMMTGAVQQVDLIQQRRGNPDLKHTRIAQATAVYGLGIGKVNLQAGGIFNGAWRLPVACYSIEGNMLVQSYRPNADWRQIDAYVSATWAPTSKFNIQLTGGYYYNGYFKDARLSAACWKASGQVAYYFGDFACNVRFETPRKFASYDLTVTRTPWLYGISLSWSHKALQIEAGADNPFLRRPLYRTALNTDIYRFDKTSYSPLNRSSAYVKVVWSVDFGKKTKHDPRNVDRNIDSGILKAQ